MSLHDFWHGEMDLIYAYEKAYYNNLYQTAYVNGLYNTQAFTIAYGNAWNKGKKADYGKDIQMVDMIDQLNQKQAEMSLKYKEEKKRAMSLKYQRQNLSWI